MNLGNGERGSMCVVIMQVEDRLETLRFGVASCGRFLGPGDWKLRKEGVICFTKGVHLPWFLSLKPDISTLHLFCKRRYFDLGSCAIPLTCHLQLRNFKTQKVYLLPGRIVNM